MTTSNKTFTKSILITIDVEDWFQVENFKPFIHFNDWSCKDLRVEENTNYLLNFFAKSKVKATFFVLGWLAKRVPHLVRKIHRYGHEVASHGYYHELCSLQTTKNLKKELTNSKKLLEDIIGLPIYGYRAPSFSINKDALKVIEECGFLYDSSFNSFKGNKRYGNLELIGNNKKGIVFNISDNLYELPISNLKFINSILPWGGGGYFRLIPLSLFKMGVHHILEKEHAYLFYLHPWEIDLRQPIVKEASRIFKFRHYIHLNKTCSKLSSFIDTFRRCHFITCQQYIYNNHKEPFQ